MVWLCQFRHQFDILAKEQQKHTEGANSEWGEEASSQLDKAVSDSEWVF